MTAQKPSTLPASAEPVSGPVSNRASTVKWVVVMLAMLAATVIDGAVIATTAVGG